jgi:hypothetical protein
MNKLYETLAPLTDWIPDPYQGYLRVEVWWLVELVVVLAVLVVVGTIVRGLLRGLWRGIVGRRRHEWDKGLRANLDDLPAVNGKPSLCVYHVPGWVRLVVVAPVGKSMIIEPETVPFLLERVVPGLGSAVLQDRPQLRIWPAPLSTLGFTNAFHRCMPTGRREDEATGWVLLAGRAQGGGHTLFVGVVLWTSEPTTFGRMNLEPRQWLDVLRLSSPGVGA